MRVNLTKKEIINSVFMQIGFSKKMSESILEDILSDIVKSLKKHKVNATNKNDIVAIFGEPSTKSTFDNDVWIYIERKITNTHFLGKRELIVNNVLVLEIDELGLLAKIEFYNIDDMNKLKFDKDNTEISFSKRGFIYDFLSSMRQKVNDPLGVRKKRREEGQ